MNNTKNSKQTNKKLYNRIPWKQAIAIGLVAFLIGFVLVAGLSEVEGALQDDDPVDDEVELEEEPGYVTNQAWVFFSAHFIDIEASATTGFGDIEESYDILSELEELPALIFYLAPVLALIGAGFALVNRNAQLVQSELDGAVFGGAVAAGYLPAVVFSTLVFDHQTELDDFYVTYEVPLVEAALIAGLLFPVVFGAIGGFIAYKRL